MAADQNLVDRRNQDYAYIAKKLVFQLPSKYERESAYSQANPWVPKLSDYPGILNGGVSAAEGLTESKLVSVFDSEYLQIDIVY